jgi:pectate lyase
MKASIMRARCVSRLLTRGAPALLLLAVACSGGSGGVTTSPDGGGAGGGTTTGAGGGSGGTGAGGAVTTGTGGGAGRGGGGGAAGMAGTGGTAGGAGTGGTAGAGGRGGAGGAIGTGGTAGATGAGGTSGTGGSTACTPPPLGTVIGWAALDGMNVPTTTGGGTAATPQIVTSVAALNAAARGTNSAIIYVSGVLPAGNIAIGSNKTIVGLCGAEVHGHVGVSGAVNTIIRNLKIVGYGVGNCALDPKFDPTVGCSSGDDAMTIQNVSHHIWIDHCDFSDGTDGNLDINSGSDFITVSWTKFHYTLRADTGGSDSTGASGHRFSSLIGSGDNVLSDAGHLNVTFHHNWWADNVNERMPRTRFGQIHVFNNLYTSAGDGYCTNSGIQTHVLVENNVYSNVKNPLSPDANGDMLARGNMFVMTTGTMTATGVGFTPLYPYTLDATPTLAATIMAQAGPH